MAAKTFTVTNRSTQRLSIDIKNADGSTGHCRLEPAASTELADLQENRDTIKEFKKKNLVTITEPVVQPAPVKPDAKGDQK